MQKNEFKTRNIEAFEHYSQFSNLKEFNSHMEMWLVEHKKEFSKAELVGLKRLVRFSAKVPGVRNAKIGTMLKVIHEEYHNNGISRSSFKRMIGKAKKLGIITVYETERKNGSQSSNLYVFNRFPINEPPTSEQLNHHKTINLSKTKNQNIKKRRTNDPDCNFQDKSISTNKKDVDNQTSANSSVTPITQEVQVTLDTFTSDKVPEAFHHLVKSFFDKAKTVEEYWKMTKIAAYRNNRENDQEQVLTIAINSFKQMINKWKLSKAIKKPIAYFYGILNKKFQHLYFEELWEMEIEMDGKKDYKEIPYSLELAKTVFGF